MSCNAKEYLNSIKRIDKEIKKKTSEIYQLKTMALSITVATDSERVQSSGDKDRLGATVAKIIDKEKEIDEEVDKYIDIKQKIINQINNMSQESYSDILYYRYVACMKWDDVMDNTHISHSHIFRLHGQALMEFEDKYLKK